MWGQEDEILSVGGDGELEQCARGPRVVYIKGQLAEFRAEIQQERLDTDLRTGVDG